jgi:hypothetical protein
LEGLFLKEIMIVLLPVDSWKLMPTLAKKKLEISFQLQNESLEDVPMHRAGKKDS